MNRSQFLYSPENPLNESDVARARCNGAALAVSRLEKIGLILSAEKMQVWADPDGRVIIFHPATGQIFLQVTAADVPALDGQGFREKGTS